MEFREKRRQQFLTEAAYTATTKFFNEIAAPNYLRSLSRPEFDEEDRTVFVDEIREGRCLTTKN